MTIKEKGKFIKNIIDNNGGTIDISVDFKGNFNDSRHASKIYRGVINNTPTNFYFVTSDKATSCFDVVTDDCIEQIYTFLKKKFAE